MMIRERTVGYDKLVSGYFRFRTKNLKAPFLSIVSLLECLKLLNKSTMSPMFRYIFYAYRMRH